MRAVTHSPSFHLHLLSFPRHRFSRLSARAMSTSLGNAGTPRLVNVTDSHAHVTPLLPPRQAFQPCSVSSSAPSRRAEDMAKNVAPSRVPSQTQPLVGSCCCCCGEGETKQTQRAGSLHPASPAVAEGQQDVPLRLSRVLVCGTHPAVDWDTVAALHRRDPRVMIGFGIHPWFAPELPTAVAAKDTEGNMRQEAAAPTGATLLPDVYTMEDLLAQLEAMLQAFPQAVVAEIGLDKLRGPSQAAQEALFLAQVRLAARYGRPVSIHCVRHYGLLLELLDKRLVYKEEVPPALVIHGFSGSASVAQSLLKMKHKKLSKPDEHAKESAEAASTATTTTTKERNSRRGAQDVVKISERVFFGIGAATSLTVKDCASATLPLLFGARRLLAETDRFYACAPHVQEDDGTERVALLAFRDEGDTTLLDTDNHPTAHVSGREDMGTAHGMLAPVLQAVLHADERAASLRSAAATPRAMPQATSATAITETENGEGPIADVEEESLDAVRRVAEALEDTFARAFASVLPS